MNVYPLRKFAFLVTSLIAFKKLLLLSYLPPDNLVLSLITFTIFYFYLLPLRKSGLPFYNVQKVHVFVCILRKFFQRGWRGWGGGGLGGTGVRRGCILNGMVLTLIHCRPYPILEERTKLCLLVSYLL